MFKATLFIFDKEYPLLNYDLRIRQGDDGEGFINTFPVIDNINLEFVATKNDADFFDAAIASRQLVKGYLRVYRRDGIQKFFDYEFANAYVVSFKENYESGNSKPTTTSIALSPGIVKKGDLIFMNRWNPSNPFIEVTPLTVIEEDNTPQIRTITWKNTDTQEEGISKINYNEKASLVAQITNKKGGTATITIEKEDGTEFENGEKTLSFTETLDEDGFVELTPLEITEQWETFKTADIDKLVAKVEHNGISQTSRSLEITPIPKAIVDFRPAKKYDGEYGFDYMRHKKEKDDKLTYKTILGKNFQYNKNTKKWVEKFTPYADDKVYKQLKCDYYDSLDFDWHKNPDGTPYEYIKSWLMLYPGQKATLSVQIDTIENSAKKDFSLEYDTNYFTISQQTITAQKKGKKRLDDHLTITSKKEFSDPQLGIIKVLNGQRQVGQLNVYPNVKANRKKAQVVFIKVTTKLNGSVKLIGNTKNKKGLCEDETLYKFLKQGYITLENEEAEFNLTQLNTKTKKLKYPNFNTNFGLLDTRISTSTPEIILNKHHNTKKATTDSLVHFMEQEFNTANPKYQDHFKVFFFGDRGGKEEKGIVKGLGGYAKDIKSKAVIVFAGSSNATVTHELLHAIGLYHTFSPLRKNKFSYEKGATTNIMDYSHLSKYGRKNRNHIWLWQMKQLWANNDLKQE